MIRRTAVVLLASLLFALPRVAGALMQLRPGDAPPPFSLPDLAGGRFGSESLAGGAAVVIFWSTWSPRSAEVLEDFKRHAAAYGERGLKILAINTDGENLGPSRQAAIREYAQALGLPFPVVLDERLAVFAAWGVMAQPTAVVLDAGGRIAYVLPGYPHSLREELEEEIRRALGLAPPPPAPEAALSGPQREAQAAWNLGRQFLAKRDPERAREAFRAAVAADPASLEAQLMVARVSLSLGSPVEAEQLVRQVGQETLGRGDLRYLLGNLMLFKGDLEAAQRTFRALEERLPAEGWGAWGLGMVALARGEHRGALSLFEQASRAQSENPEAEAYVRRYFRDRCLRQEPLPEEAGFVRLFPGLAEIRERYCRLFEQRRPADAGGR